MGVNAASASASSTPLKDSSEQPASEDSPDIELLNASDFLSLAHKDNLTVFAARLDIQAASAIGSTPTVNLSAVLTTKDYQKSNIATDERGVPFAYQKFSSVFASDPAWLNDIRSQTAASPLLRKFREGKLNNSFTLEDGILLRDGLIALPTESLQLTVFKRRHCSAIAGHFGIAKTKEAISRDYWFPRMRRVIKHFIANCDLCQRSRASRHAPYGLLQPLPVPQERWWDISMDFIVGLPLSNNFDAIFVVKDRLSKQAHFIPIVMTASGSDVASIFVKEVFRLHGMPRAIVSDRDSKFTSAFWKRFTELLGIKLHMSSAFHPQTDGSTEVTNQVIEQYLRVFCNYQQDN